MLHVFRESFGKYVAIAILGLIGVTFIFFGIDFSVTRSPFAAKVNRTEIPMASFDQELLQFQTQYQDLYRIELTDDLRRELRRTVVDQLVLRESLRQHASKAGYYVSDAKLAESIRDIEAFQIGGEFSPDSYRARLQQNGLTPAQFEASQREALVLAEFQAGLTASAFLTPAEFRRYIELTNQRREIGYATFEAASFIQEPELDDAEIQAFFDASPGRFMTPESVDIEYVSLELRTVANTIEISDDDLRAYYEEVQDRFETTEERSVSHILITVDGDDYQSAEDEAQSVLERLAAGESFEALVEEVSDDGGTRNAGGSLGWIARGVLTGPFEDALFAMEQGAIEGPVETEFGYHILRLDELRSGQVQAFETVREDLREELSTDQANTLFFDQANALRQAAFDAYDALAPAAESQGLELVSIDGFERSGRPDLFPDGVAVVDRVFSEEAIVSGRNSDLLELSEDHVVIVRVREHHEPQPRPIDDVRDEIAAELRFDAAQTLAADAAREFFSALEASAEEDPAALAEEHRGTWVEPQWVGRADPDVPPELLASVFADSPGSIANGSTREVTLQTGDIAVVMISGVEVGDPEAIAVAERDQRQRLLAEQTAQLEAAAYAANVRDEATVRIPDEVLDPDF